MYLGGPARPFPRIPTREAVQQWQRENTRALNEYGRLYTAAKAAGIPQSQIYNYVQRQRMKRTGE